MPINLFHHLRVLNQPPRVPLQSLQLWSSIRSLSSTVVVFRVFHSQLAHSGFGSPQLCLRPSSRRFSNRSSHMADSRRSEFGREQVRASRSLVEDEAELSDWVSDLRTGSMRSGRVTSDEDEDIRSGGKRGGSKKGKVLSRGRENDRDNVFVRKSRENESYRSRGLSVRRGFDEGNDTFNPKKRRFPGTEYSNERSLDRGREAGDRRNGNKLNVRGRRVLEKQNEGEFLENGDHSRPKHRFSSRRESGSREFGNGTNSSSRGRLGKSSRGGTAIVSDEDGDRFNDSEDDDEEEEEEFGRLESDLGKFLQRDKSDEDELEENESDVLDSDEDSEESNVRSSLGLVKGGNKIRKQSTGESESYLSETRFDQLPISPSSLKGVQDAGYEKLTIVQEATLPVILKGKDVLAKAKTGTGKTVAFLLPSVEVIAKIPPVGRDQKRPPILVLVVCPTRELANQAAAEANTLLKYHSSLGAQVVIGGTRLALEQKRMQANPCQILVATPGRLRDHLENTPGFATRLMGLKVLILDEADLLLDMGFRKDIENIIASVPKQRQTLLFSATVPDEVRQICHLALKRDHEFINTVEEGSEETHEQVQQMLLVAPLDKQFATIYSILKDHIADNNDYKVLVFCTTAMITGMVADLLAELRLNVRTIHSRKSQSYRTKVSDEFRKSKGLILVTSDVSARGVDYPDVTMVIQVGLPADRQQYIHRLGRTGRKGKEGQGILLLAPWEEFFTSGIKDLPITKNSLPPVDPDSKKKVEQALSRVELKSKTAAYQSWLGYYNSNKTVGRDKYKLVELANDFSHSMGLDNPPPLPKVVVGKMGLSNVPGLRSK